jgi:hypothetical protein
MLCLSLFSSLWLRELRDCDFELGGIHWKLGNGNKLQLREVLNHREASSIQSRWQCIVESSDFV